MKKVLFVLKRREDFNPEKHDSPSLQCLLYNSISYVRDLLIKNDIDSQIAICIDNNCINGFIYNYKPTHVIIEALWVVPEKIKLLQSMYPNIIFIIRLHSAVPFLSVESSVSFKWIAEYVQIPNTFISVNDKRLKRELEIYLSNINEKEVIYLPNNYPLNITNENKDYNLEKKDVINIACFGAIRPFKNNMTQAIASIEFAKIINKKLRFHINSNRYELNGGTLNTNMIHMFDKLGEQFELVCHPWCSRDDFLKICENEIDIGLQVSFTETFNIVSADLLSNKVPVIGSSEIPYLKRNIANVSDVDDIVGKLLSVYKNSEENVKENLKCLEEYLEETKKIWMEYFK